MNKLTIKNLTAREILDSRGNPTVEADVYLSNGSLGRASIPSGASTGSREAHELRDGNENRYGGYGVLKAVQNIKSEIKQQLIGKAFKDQRDLDETMIDLDGTADKRRLGANSILPVSIAYARAYANSMDQSLYAYIGDQYSGTKATEDYIIPVPMFNIINGGKHAYESTDFQEFMVIPSGFNTYEAMQMLRGLRGLNVIGGDLVEVSPPWDPSGITGLNGAQMMFEILCLIAENHHRA